MFRAVSGSPAAGTGASSLSVCVLRCPLEAEELLTCHGCLCKLGIQKINFLLTLTLGQDDLEAVIWCLPTAVLMAPENIFSFSWCHTAITHTRAKNQCEIRNVNQSYIIPVDTVLFFICVCVILDDPYMPKCLCMCLFGRHAHMCARVQCQMNSRSLSTLLFETESVPGSEAHWLDQAGPPANSQDLPVSWPDRSTFDICALCWWLFTPVLGIQPQVLLLAFYWLSHLPSPWPAGTCATQCLQGHILLFWIQVVLFLFLFYFVLVSCEDELTFKKAKG